MNELPIFDGFFQNNVGCLNNHLTKSENKAKRYEKSQIFIFNMLERNCFEKW